MRCVDFFLTFLMAANPDQCALAADGSLLDASAITFYNDPDDDTPLPDSSATSAPTHPFFRGSLAPAKITAGSRRSARVIRPSARITDPDNAEASAGTRKRSATVTVSAEASSRAARRAKLSDGDDGGDDDSEHHDEPDIAEDVGDDDDMGNTTTEQEDGGDDTDVELVEEAYRTTKAMGDADRQVCLTFISIPGERLISGSVVPQRASEDYTHR